MKQFLLVTDLDNTLIGDDHSLALLNNKLTEHRQKYDTKIVYATGRSLSLYRQLAQEKQLLSPDAIIAAVGTEIYYDPNCAPDITWSQQLSIGWDRDLIVSIVAHFADLIPQIDIENPPFKVSYYLAKEAAIEILPRLEARLKAENLEFQIIYSSKRDLDILPKYGNKGLAMEFLQKKWGVEPHNTVVCGDSGNDIALLNVNDERGIIVGNAKPELVLWDEVNPTPHHYLAKSSYAGGILEGLYYFGFLLP